MGISHEQVAFAAQNKEELNKNTETVSEVATLDGDHSIINS